MGMGVSPHILTADKNTVVLPAALIQPHPVMADHVRPEAVDVHAAGVVDHVRREPAGGAHVDLQAQKVAFPSQALLILPQAEELKMHQAAFDTEGFHSPSPGVAQVFRQLRHDHVDGFRLLVDHVHHRHQGQVARFVQRLPRGADEGVIGADLPVDELLQHVGAQGQPGEEGPQRRFVADPEGVVRAHADVRFGNERITSLFSE